MREIAKALLDVKAISLSPKKPFTWSSGTESPIYCDNRLTLSYPDVRKAIAKAFSEIIKKQFPNVEVIAGTATSGIPHAAWLADELQLPMVYVRSKAKKHGRENQIEGRLHKGQEVVLIEDLISTGASALRAANALKDAGVEVVAVLAIFTYGFHESKRSFREAQIFLETLTDYHELIQVAEMYDLINKSDIEDLEAWYLKINS